MNGIYFFMNPPAVRVLVGAAEQHPDQLDVPCTSNRDGVGQHLIGKQPDLIFILYVVNRFNFVRTGNRVSREVVALPILARPSHRSLRAAQ